MTLPALVLALVVALLIGALFHLAVDGGPGRLVLSMMLSVLGFAAGQWFAQSQGWIFMPVGPIQMGAAIPGALIVLLLGNWLSKVRVRAVD